MLSVVLISFSLKFPYFYFLLKYARPGRSKNKLMILLSSSKAVIMVNSKLSLTLEPSCWRESPTRSIKALSPSVFDIYRMIVEELIRLFNFVCPVGVVSASTVLRAG